MRNEMIDLIQEAVGGCSTYWAGRIADHLIANGGTIQRWIPVEERLPEQDCRVAVLYRFPRSDMKFSTVFDYYASDPVPHFQHTMGEGGPIVTHWAELPKEEDR